MRIWEGLCALWFYGLVLCIHCFLSVLILSFKLVPIVCSLDCRGDWKAVHQIDWPPERCTFFSAMPRVWVFHCLCSTKKLVSFSVTKPSSWRFPYFVLQSFHAQSEMGTDCFLTFDNSTGFDLYRLPCQGSIFWWIKCGASILQDDALRQGVLFRAVLLVF